MLKQISPEREAVKKRTAYGRPRKLNAEKVALAKKLYDNPENTVAEICKTLGVSKPTFYAYLYERHVK